MKPLLQLCKCWKCFFEWEDFPGVFAQWSRNGCPKCGHLYWTETPKDS